MVQISYKKKNKGLYSKSKEKYDPKQPWNKFSRLHAIEEDLKAKSRDHLLENFKVSMYSLAN